MIDVSVLWQTNPSCHLPSSKDTLSYLIHNVQGRSGKVLDGRDHFIVKPFSVTLFVKQHSLSPWQKVSPNV